MADLDRLLREQNPEPGQPRVPVPQYQKVDGVGFERVTGRHGGAHSVLLGPDGRPISSDNRLPVDTGLSGNLQIIADNQGRLYGRTASGNWLPVRVNGSGQLELAQNVVIDNVTVNVGAEVKVNNNESEPVPVQLSGNIVPLSRLSSGSSAWRFWGTSVSTTDKGVELDVSGYSERMVILENSTNAVVSSVALRMYVIIDGGTVTSIQEEYDKIPAGATLIINGANSEIINQAYTHLTLRSITGSGSGHTEGEQKFTVLGRN